VIKLRKLKQALDRIHYLNGKMFRDFSDSKHIFYYVSSGQEIFPSYQKNRWQKHLL